MTDIEQVDSNDIEGPCARLFVSCADDPKGSIHRAWSLSLLFIGLFFIVAIIEVINLNNGQASVALKLAAGWTVVTQICLAVGGTFILKRFSTSFSVGFLLGLVVLVAQQNLLLSVTFWDSTFGSQGTNVAFANLSFALFAIYCVFGAVLAHFREHIMISPVDAKPFGGLA